MKLVVGIFSVLLIFFAQAEDLPNFEELAVIRAKAHQDRFRVYVLKKLEVYSLVQKKRGLCFDFIGDSDGLYRSMFKGGPLMVDLANCGEEDDLVDGRIRALKVLEPKEQQDGLSTEQVDQVIDEINILFSGKIYDPDTKG